MGFNYQQPGKVKKADLAIFDPRTILDRSTVEKPQAFPTGMRHVFVNGQQVLRNGEPTGALPGQVVRGPGWRGWPGGGACKQKAGRSG